MRKLLLLAVVICSAGASLALVPLPMVRAEPATRLARVSVDTAHMAAADLAGSAEQSAGVAMPFPLSHLAAQWNGDHDAEIDIRWQANGAWQQWQPLSYDADSSEGTPRLSSSLVRTPDATRVDVRVVRGAVSNLELVAIDTTHSYRHVVVASHPAVAHADTSSTSSTSSPPSQQQSQQSPPKIAEPPVITRAEWGADESMRKGTPEFAPISKLIVHHTDTQNNDPDPAATVRAIYAYHTQGNGWDDIGYNFLIDEEGRVYEGRWARPYDQGEKPTGEDRDENGVVGAHALNANTGSVGVALLGTFTDQPPTDAAMNTLKNFLAYDADRHNIDAFGDSPFAFGDGSTRTFANISGHRDTYQTDCPGDDTYDQLASIRQAVDSDVGAARHLTRGYWVAGHDGGVFTFGQAQFYGSMGGTKLNAPITAMAPSPTGLGYWMMGRDGGIFTFGDAGFFGSTGSMKLNAPVVALQPTPTGKGYWLVAKDGGIFSFGDARFFGSTGNMHLNEPVVGMTATPTGKGYWLVASDGGIFSFGDATFHGSTGSMHLNSPVIAMAAPPNAAAGKQGYWLVARDGGIFAFDTPYKGSVPGLNLSSYAGSADMKPAPDGQGYYVLGSDGGIFSFGSANFLGSHAGMSAAAMAIVPEPAPSS